MKEKLNSKTLKKLLPELIRANPPQGVWKGLLENSRFTVNGQVGCNYEQALAGEDWKRVGKKKYKDHIKRAFQGALLHEHNYDLIWILCIVNSNLEDDTILSTTVFIDYKAFDCSSTCGFKFQFKDVGL